jgi:azurin
MQHNVLIVEPGTIDAVGALADAMATRPGAAEQDYVPDTPSVLYASDLVDPRAETTLTFVAPETPGTYPYLCTFPGHWRIMQGTMEVTAP